jgi:phospholipid/cholesterol/gamma-HCH transport system substrate-binding protein
MKKSNNFLNKNMADQGKNNIKLGVFVFAGLIALMLAFYLIGQNQNLFGSSFQLKARFSNLSGLMEGDNVLFSGINAGTVKSTEIINDTTIEVTMRISSDVKAYIHKNAVAGIGTEGLMGNKVVNIIPVKGNSPAVADGDLLAAQQGMDMDAIIATLSKTNNNAASISEGLKTTVLRLDSSPVIALLMDKAVCQRLRSALQHLDETTENASEMTAGLNQVVANIKHGKGTAGMLLTDTAIAHNLKSAVSKIKSASDNANLMTVKLNHIVDGVNNDLADGNGPLHTLLRDTGMANNLSRTMVNLKNGTDGFNQNMEALKHNFLFRGYFKNLDKQKKKDQAKSQITPQQ